MQPRETVQVESTKVACNGGGGALGHPRVWLNMGDKPAVDCPYCGRHFVLKAHSSEAGAAAHAGH